MDNNYRGTAIANTHYFIAIFLYLTISPFSIFTTTLHLSSALTLSALGFGLYTYFLIVAAAIITFWVKKKGLLPVHEEGERSVGIIIIAIANFLLLIGVGVFAYFVSQAKGGGTISGVPLGMWLGLCMLIQLIGIILVEWKRWGNSSNPKVYQLIALGVLIIPALFILLPLLIQIMMGLFR